MANTLPNTQAVGVVSSTPKLDTSRIQGISANASMPTNNTVAPNQMNPITVPIQIQPQITNAGYSPFTNGQAVASPQASVPTQTQTAPTPQVYQGNNQNNSQINFDQIYSAYQSQYGNTYNSNPNTNNSGIKKTSIGTTIVTPNTQNLNTVKGQYQSAYSDTINSVISTLLEETQNMKNGFNYDPSQDMALRVASEYAANSTMQSLAGSGVLNSSSTAERVARIVSDLIPQYEKLAYDRQVQYLNQLANTANIVMEYDSQQFQYWKDAKDREFQEKEFEFNKQQKELENAWKRVDELGYVDNKASTILGVKVGTLSGKAREAKEQKEFELAKMREQAQIEYKNNVAIAKLKSELDLNSSKELAKYKSNIDLANSKELANYQNSLTRSNKEYDYQLAAKYGTSSSKNSNSDYTSYSTHDEVIKNRWGIEDAITGQISVNDGTTNNNDAVYNYLANAYATGRISPKDFAALIAKYGITVPSQKASTTATKTNSNNGSNSYGYGSGGGFR